MGGTIKAGIQSPVGDYFAGCREVVSRKDSEGITKNTGEKLKSKKQLRGRCFMPRFQSFAKKYQKGLQDCNPLCYCNEPSLLYY
jgi:hypothetical protein